MYSHVGTALSDTVSPVFRTDTVVKCPVLCVTDIVVPVLQGKSVLMEGRRGSVLRGREYKVLRGGGEIGGMVQRVRVLTALTEDLDSVPSTTASESSSRRSKATF